MALIDKASLMMVPSLVEDGTLYNVLPTGNFAADKTDNNNGYDSTRADFTFTRDADIEATRVNSSGLIEKAKVNLLLQSNSFDTTWSTSSASVTGGQSGYDGSSDAWLLSGSGANARVQQSITTSGVHSISVYAKAGTYNFLRVRLDTSGGAYDKFFDLQNGSLGSSDNTAPIDASIEAVSGATGWYRCSFAVSDTTTIVRLYTALADSSGTGAGSIYIQDAQLNHGLVAQDYVETTTTAVVEGLTADLPRLDYSGGASCPSLLLEPSRTNLVTQSEYFASFWTNIDASVTHNAIISPEGVQNAAKLVESTSLSTHYLRSGFMTTTNGSTLTTSLFLKAGERTEIALFENAYNGHFVYADLVAESVTTNGIDADIEPLENGWFRIYIIDDAFASTRWQIRLGKDGSTSYQGDGTSGAYIYGFQVENQASYPTSYIPTYGTAAVRGDDYVYVAQSGNADFGSGDFSVFFDVENVDDNESGATALIGNRQSGEWWRFYGNKAQNRVHLEMSSSGGGYTATIIGTYEQFVDGRNKVVISRDSSRLICYVNGVEKINSTAAVYLQNFDGTNTSIELNSWQSGANANTNANYNQVLIFKGTALTPSECQSLTTI